MVVRTLQAGKKFIFNAFVDLKPVERFENESNMLDLGALKTVRATVLNMCHQQAATDALCHTCCVTRKSNT